MCGFAGIVQFDSLQFDEFEHLERLSNLIEKRGPDGTRLWNAENVGMAHSLLNIVGKLDSAFQPFVSACGQYVLVFNGEVYNHLQLKEHFFSDHQFVGNSDTEVLLQGLVRFGVDFMGFVDGIYSFAFVDFNTQRVFLVRDFFGTKPLYYYHTDQRLVFASELGFVSTNLGEFLSIEVSVLADYVNKLWLEAPKTPFREIKKIDPNHVLEVDLKTGQSKMRQVLVGNEQKNSTVSKLSERYWVDKLEECLLESLRLQTQANTSVGYLLSGGLDSSLLLSMAVKHGLCSSKTKAFSLLAEQGEDFDGFENDWPFAVSLAGHLGIELIGVEAEQISENSFKKWVLMMDEPVLSPAVIGLDSLCGKAKQEGFRVLLSGLGADELFGGYRRHQLLLETRFLPLIPYSLFKLLRPLFGNRERQFVKLSNVLCAEKTERITNSFDWLSDVDAEKLLRNKSQKTTNNKELNWKNIVDTEINTYLSEHNLLFADRVGMKNHVEIRVPFLTQKIYEIGLHTTARGIDKHLTGKYLLRKMAEKYLPKHIICRKKTGFGGSLKHFFGNYESAFWKKYFDSVFLDHQGVFDAKALNQLLEMQLSGKADYSYPLLAYITVQVWLEENGK